MAGRLIRSLLFAFLFVAFTVLIFRFYDWGIELERLQEQYVEACLRWLELHIENLAEQALEKTDSPNLDRYTEIAKKLGGYVGFDKDLKQIVVAVRKDNDVKTAIFMLNLNPEEFEYYVCDPSNTVLDASNKSMVGKNIELVLPDLSSGSIVKYEGKVYLFKQRTSQRFGFRIFIGIPYRDSRLQSYLVMGLAIVLFLISLSWRRRGQSEERISRAIEDIINTHRFDEKSIRNTKLKNQLSKLANKLEHSERILRETAQKLQDLKQLLEKRKAGS
ncbi:hypothetical protein AS159_00550 [Thermotoga sp. Ku-13t]|uniref:hypothetical protein n=1 Tax=Thermotoga sp. Ku-13t TaxID=1755813 RepID=UPI0013EA6E83|nr:hypothetical protein [Thermotoga sp. Ku-13t]KAF2958244.1 hypothetical protein AS159_00550 [Thermotoga sp. Ku-13t]